MVEIDSRALFNGAAAAISTIAVVFFIVNVEFGYSPVSKVALVFAFLAGVFAITQRTTDHQLTVLGYGVIVISVVALFFDAVNTFDVGNTPTVIGLLVLAGILFYLGTRLDEDSRFVTGTRATRALGVVAALAAVVLVVDVATGGLVYELQPRNQVEYAGPEDEAVVASVGVTNPTPLPERVRTPNYRVCTAGNWSAHRLASEPNERKRSVQARVSVRDGYDEYVFGYGRKTYPVELYLTADVRGETFPVRTTSACPDEETGPPYIALFEVPEDRPYGRPV